MGSAGCPQTLCFLHPHVASAAGIWPQGKLKDTLTETVKRTEEKLTLCPLYYCLRVKLSSSLAFVASCHSLPRGQRQALLCNPKHCCHTHRTCNHPGCEWDLEGNSMPRYLLKRRTCTGIFTAVKSGNNLKVHQHVNGSLDCIISRWWNPTYQWKEMNDWWTQLCGWMSETLLNERSQCIW